MTAAAFITFVAAMAVVVVALSGRFLHRRAAGYVLGGLCAWFIYVSAIGYTGVVRNTTMRPPGIAFLAAPVVVFLVAFVARVSTSKHGVGAIPLRILLGLQSFRVGVELFLHQLWLLGIVPKMLTFAGANVDIYVGASAPLIAWLSTRGRGGLKLALAWNVLGFLALANVVIRSVLTAPGPLHRIHSEVPNSMFETFPYLLIPAFFVPLAVMLHTLAIRSILDRLHEGHSAAADAANASRLAQEPST